jgi:cyclophilin family peptidyl-prolyl cis-trans isomerase
MRQILKFAFPFLAIMTAASAEVLVNTRLYPSETIAKESTFQLDLREYFQLYADPGPVATFEIYSPVQAGFKELVPEDGSLLDLTEESPASNQYMTYELTAGGAYGNVFDAAPDAFNWATTTVDFQLLASEAPTTVANFMTYVTDGVYENTIIHRSDVDVVQAGGWRISDSEEFILQQIETRDPIPYEESRDNTLGTLGMARTQSFDSATSQFFVNLEDNTGSFRNLFTVFGEVVNPEASMPILQEMGDAFVYNLTQFYRSVPFVTTPLYTPFWDDKDSFLRFQSITIPQGNPDGVTYSWEFLDADGVEGVSDEEAANRAAFNISIDGSNLNISRSDTGTAPIRIKGTSGTEERTFDTFLIAYNPQALEAFPTSFIRQGGWLENSWFTWLVADDFPYIRHLNHGYQYVILVEGNTVSSGTFYLYDYKLGSWLYTRPASYPLLYAYSLNAWLWYERDTGNGFDEDRIFYNYSTGEYFGG